MRLFLTFIFFLTATIPLTYSQTDTTQSMDALLKQGRDRAKQMSAEKEREKERHKFGCSIFGGLGKGGNDIVDGLGSGGSIRVHYRIHTININASNVDRLEYHGGQSSSSTLHSSGYGLTYGVGTYNKDFSASIGAGLGYSFVNMSTGGGVNYNYTHYEKYGVCIGGQFSAHGKFVGFGIQTYFNVTNPATNYILLVGLEIRIW